MTLAAQNNFRADELGDDLFAVRNRGRVGGREIVWHIRIDTGSDDHVAVFRGHNIIAQRASVPPPPLAIVRTDTNTVVVFWPSRWVGFVLQRNVDLSPTNWRFVTNAVSVVGANNEVILSPVIGHEFFRLVYP